MPIVKVNIRAGRSSEFKKTLLDTIHQGLVDSMGIEDWDRFQRIEEFSEEDYEKPDFKSDDFMIIELTLFPGRTVEQKRAAVETITSGISQKLGIRAEDIFILINEPPLENWGMGGKLKCD